MYGSNKWNIQFGYILLFIQIKNDDICCIPICVIIIRPSNNYKEMSKLKNKFNQSRTDQQDIGL